MNRNAEFLKNRIAKLKERLASNAISDEARAEVEATIEGLRAAASQLESIRDTNAEGEADNSEAMLTQMRELLARIDGLEEKIQDQTENQKVAKMKVNNTKDYTQKFYNFVMSTTDRKDFRDGIKNFAVQNGITVDSDAGLADLLPASVLKEINDIFVGHRHRLLELVDWTGLPVFKAFWESGGDMANTWPSAMLGQEPSEAAKTEQGLEFIPVVIRPQYVYKYLTVDKEMVRASEDEGSVLIRYIARELLDRLLCTIEGYILNGNTGNFIAPSTEVLKADSNSNPLYHALNYLPNNEGLVAVVTRSFYADLLQQVQVGSNYIMTANADDVIRNILGVDEVLLTPPGFTASEANAVGVWFLNPRAYKMVGDRRPDEYEDFNLAWNKKEYLTEMWCGGGCVTPEFVCLTSE